MTVFINFILKIYALIKDSLIPIKQYTDTMTHIYYSRTSQSKILKQQLSINYNMCVAVKVVTYAICYILLHIYN